MTTAGKQQTSFEDSEHTELQQDHIVRDFFPHVLRNHGGCGGNNNNKKSNDMLSLSSSMHQTCSNSNGYSNNSNINKPTSLRRKILRRFSVGASTTGIISSNSSNLTNLRAMQQGLAVGAPPSSSSQSDEFSMSKRPKTITPERRRHPQRSKSSPMENPSTSSSSTTTSIPSPTNTSVLRSSPPCSPQNYLDSLLRSRGYSTLRFDTLQTAYYNKPTRLQTASYNHEYFTKLLRKKDHLETFRAMLSSGISPNPCNASDHDGGSSLLHLCCRRGNFALLRILLHEFHVPTQVADANGRTPLHDACCYAGIPSFEAVELLLNQDVRLLYFCDNMGCTPLEYISKSDWSAWMVFLRRHRDVYWPVQHDGVKAYNSRRASLGGGGGGEGGGMPRQQQRPPPLALLPPNSRPLPDPVHALPRHIAARVASGNMSPEEATQYRIDALLSCHNNTDNNTHEATMNNANNGLCKLLLVDNNHNHNHNNNKNNDRLDKLLHWQKQSEKSMTSVATANRSIASGLSSNSGGSNITNITWDEQETAEVLRSLTAPLGTARPIAWCGGGGGERGDHHRSRNYNRRPATHVALTLKDDDDDDDDDDEDDYVACPPPNVTVPLHQDDDDDDDACPPPPLLAKASTWSAPLRPSLAKAATGYSNEAAPQHLYFL